MQPSAQGIASLFMGNPGALAARVDQDRKQSPMGIPDDLRQLMALNIVTTENDAAKRQQALQQLQQMAPNGQPPTVADNVRQQATQKLQARMVQEQQKQQAMQQMMSGLPAVGVPENVPQPQGIDQAPVEFGMAGGGIVSFQNRGSVPEPTEADLEKQRREDAEKIKALRKYLGVAGKGLSDAAIDAMIKAGAAGMDIATLIPRGLAGAADTAIIRPLRALGADIGYISPELTPGAQSPDTPTPFYDRYIRAKEQAEEASAPAPAPAPAPTSVPATPDNRAVNREMLNRADAAMFAARPERAAPAPVAKDLRDAARMGRKPAPPVAKAPAVPQPEPKQEENKDPRLSPQGLLNMGSAAQLQDEAEYERRIGAPSTAALDRLMAEYERQKAATEGPKAGWGGLAEYMAQIAATPRGMRSFEAGAAGARGVQALEKERAAQRAALTEKQIALEQKKLDAARDYAKEKFGVGKAAFDRAYKNNLDIFKDQGLDYRQAELFAQQKTLKDIDFANQKELEKIRGRNQAAMRPFDVQGEYAKALLAGDTKRAETLLKAMEARRPGMDMEMLKKFESLPGVKSDLETLNTLRSIRDPKPAVIKQINDIEARLASKALANKIDPAQIGLGPTSTSGGGQRTIDWNAIK